MAEPTSKQLSEIWNVYQKRMAEVEELSKKGELEVGPADDSPEAT